MLGYLCNLLNDMGPVSRFIPASPAYPRHPDQVNWKAIDARHGRVLLRSVRGRPRISVWDPVTGERWELPPLSDAWYEDDEDYWNAAVLCAATGCGHLDCRGKPFLVVCAGSCGTEMISLCIYSSETGSWSEPIFAAPRPEYGVTDQAPPALVGNTLYFMVRMGTGILRYDLVTREATMDENLAVKSLNYSSVPMALEDGGMALGVENYSKLFLWSMETSPKGDISWKKIRMIELNELLPVTVRDRPVDVNCFAFVPPFGILVYTPPRLFSIDLMSDKVEVVCEGRYMSGIVPYRSFYIPGITLHGF
ncbi:hypothetical protein HU200_015910 [Digitaria exilis]|uniref:Uncharacterized protein n=1 Tax=Digitaria exilis TaxID=1010633 RepID=A0A835F8Y2_9POAL|nr:hypothetical protein HU200_015910 [Digitaria exilis]